MRKTRRRILLVCAAVFAAGSLAKKAQAAADSLTIRAGFYGGPYYEVVTFSDEKMRGMSDGYVWTYSGADSGGFMRLCYAWGVPLSFLLECGGIDLSSVGYLHMGTEDNYQEYYATFSADTLLRERYFYPNMVQLADLNGSMEQTLPFGALTGEEQENPQPVPALLAIGCTEFSRWDYMEAAKNGYASYDRSQLPEDYKYRLIYGQLGLDSLEAALNVQESDKWVFEINVQLAGAPEITVSRTLTEGEEGEVGSRYQVDISVDLPPGYGYLPEEILQNLSNQVLESLELRYDSSVAALNQTGTGQYEMEITGEGQTTLEAYYARQEYDGAMTQALGQMEVTGHMPAQKTAETPVASPTQKPPKKKNKASENKNRKAENPAPAHESPSPAETPPASYVGIAKDSAPQETAPLPEAGKGGSQEELPSEEMLSKETASKASSTKETPQTAKAQKTSSQWMGVETSALKQASSATASVIPREDASLAGGAAAGALIVFLMGVSEAVGEFYKNVKKEL